MPIITAVTEPLAYLRTQTSNTERNQGNVYQHKDKKLHVLVEEVAKMVKRLYNKIDSQK